MSSTVVIVPFCFENDETLAVNGTRYLERGINPKKIWFPQDDPTLQTTQHFTDWLHQTFNGHFISFETANVWHSPDLSPLDFFL